MDSAVIHNDFLLGLLDLQQDGKSAISAPTNWTAHEPLLQVPTDIDPIIDNLLDTILRGVEENDIARWHFFIGSPGNGKSAAMGKLCRQLRSKECQIIDENNVPISELNDPSSIPYALYVQEGSNRFNSVLIVQDASVVRNPFSPNVDPATELLDTLEYAWKKGISLVVCTNRGVLEKAHRDNHTSVEVNSKPWFEILTRIIEAKPSLHGEVESNRTFDARKTVFSQVKIGYSFLDNRSLLMGSDTFERLVQKATRKECWELCTSCPVCSICPFKANREWLADDNGREQVLQLLRRAEVLSGQVIVFREALALISFILAGCPDDYGTVHPCEWVQGKVQSGDIFSLATRRIYMDLFMSYAPYGLEVVERQRKQQVNALRDLRNIIDQSKTQAQTAIEHVIGKRFPSTSVGVTRLLGKDGIIASLDPCREALPAEFYDHWDSDFNAFHMDDSPFITEIEVTCMSIWNELEDSLEQAADHSRSGTHWAMRRWSSNFLLHLGALVEGRSAWAKELDEFAMLIQLVTKPTNERSLAEKRAIKQLDTRLENLLDPLRRDHDASKIQLSETVTLTGEWVKSHLQPQISETTASRSVLLEIRFPGGECAVFAAPMYLWLVRRAEGSVDPRCFPQSLLAGMRDARVRAAASGKYAFADNNVELVIDVGDGEQIRLTRLDGDVDVTPE